LHVLLLKRLDRHGSQAWTTSRFSDGSSIVAIILRPLSESNDVLCWDEDDVMAKLLELAGPVLRARAGLNGDRALREVAEEEYEVISVKALVKSLMTTLINAPEFE
jgi:hypothetical protein